MDSKPAPPPAAVLIRLVRKAAGLSVSEAARRASANMPKGISTARWSQIENGYEIRAGGHIHPVEAEAGMLAHMAGIVGLDAERLATEGQRPDAAGILREIGRRAAVPAPAAPATRPRLPRATPEMQKAMAGHLARIKELVAAAERDFPGQRLTGAMIFPRDEAAAAWWWDRIAASEEFQPEDIPSGVAAQLAWDDQEAQLRESGYATG